MKIQAFARIRKQSGFTLMELIGGLIIIALVIVGSLGLYGIATGDNTENQMIKDVMAIQSSTQGMYAGRGGYGNAVLNSTLITNQKIPQDLSVSGSTIKTMTGGTLVVTGLGSTFSIAVTQTEAPTCSALITKLSSGWSSVTVNGNAVASSSSQFPISPDAAAASNACGGTAPFSITWTSLN